MLLGTRHAIRTQAGADRFQETLHVDLELCQRNPNVLDGGIETVYAHLMNKKGKKKRSRRDRKRAWRAR